MLEGKSHWVWAVEKRLVDRYLMFGCDSLTASLEIKRSAKTIEAKTTEKSANHRTKELATGTSPCMCHMLCLTGRSRHLVSSYSFSNVNEETSRVW